MNVYGGEFETPTLAQLRDRVRTGSRERRSISVREVVANVQHLHADNRNANALFQVASQFNLLEMVGPEVTMYPDSGRIGVFERMTSPEKGGFAGWYRISDAVPYYENEHPPRTRPKS